MRLGMVICVVAGHRWIPAADLLAPVAILRCRRCNHEMVVSRETFEAESWLERSTRAQLADQPWFDPRAVDPRIHERRR